MILAENLQITCTRIVAHQECIRLLIEAPPPHTCTIVATPQPRQFKQLSHVDIQKRHKTSEELSLLQSCERFTEGKVDIKQAVVAAAPPQTCVSG